MRAEFCFFCKFRSKTSCNLSGILLFSTNSAHKARPSISSEIHLFLNTTKIYFSPVSILFSATNMHFHRFVAQNKSSLTHLVLSSRRLIFFITKGGIIRAALQGPLLCSSKNAYMHSLFLLTSIFLVGSRLRSV